ncbi:alpha/beta fold hydrolase [Halalkalibacter alkalisediminis]|uniref:Alpha/beta fold hydrolase n=1 Tax=Halalkalibacter alkalisediminis TaxID=935616 RepID=A0ABV6NEM6_9BACI|nr:alpha/beta hydrolase [Halalkalibacter alkalisediminis]
MVKETIIFLHGIVGNKNAFKKEIEKLKADYDCIAYDFYDPEDLGVEGFLSLDLLVEQLYNKYKKAGIEQAHLCTLSFGCIVAMAFAKKYPHMVISMTYVGGYCCKVPSQFNTNLRKVLKEKRKCEYDMWLKRYASMLSPNTAFIAEDSESIFFTYALLVHPHVLDYSIRLQLEFDTKAALSQMQIPILWVMGEYDELYKSTLTHLKKYNPYVEYKEIKQAGHVAHIHQPQQFLSLFQSFLTKHKLINRESLSGV